MCSGFDSSHQLSRSDNRDQTLPAGAWIETVSVNSNKTGSTKPTRCKMLRVKTVTRDACEHVGGRQVRCYLRSVFVRPNPRRTR